MKILMVNKFLYPRGGSESYMLYLAEHLQRLGHQVEFFGMYDEKNTVGNSAGLYTQNMDFHGKGLARFLYPFKIIYSLEAKKKIISANLQAKHALEELRESVHLLSGMNENQTLKTALEGIIHESMDGTGIVIRSQIDDVFVYPAKFRFLCNTLKEGISNGLRHGGATAFWFELKKEKDTLVFLLSDNGKGLAGKTLAKGFGLTSTQDRAKALGGKLRIVSEEDEGFELHLTLPADAE